MWLDLGYGEFGLKFAAGEARPEVEFRYGRRAFDGGRQRGIGR